MGDIIINEDVPAGETPADASLQLQYPFTARFKKGGEERIERISSLTVRRIKAGDLEEMMKVKDEMAQLRILFVRLTGQPEAVYREIDAEDLSKFGDLVNSFLPESQAIGKKP